MKKKARKPQATSKIRPPSLSWKIKKIAGELDSLKEKLGEINYQINEINDILIYLERLPDQYGDIEKSQREIVNLLHKSMGDKDE